MTLIDNTLKLISRNLPFQIPGLIELFSKYKHKANKRGIPGYIFRPTSSCFPLFIVHNRDKKDKYKK